MFSRLMVASTVIVLAVGWLPAPQRRTNIVRAVGDGNGDSERPSSIDSLGARLKARRSRPRKRKVPTRQLFVSLGGAGGGHFAARAQREQARAGFVRHERADSRSRAERRGAESFFIAGAANDYLEVAKNDKMLTEEEAEFQREQNANAAAIEPPIEAAERYSRFGDWFSVLSK